MSKEIDPIKSLCEDLKRYDVETFDHSTRVANDTVGFVVFMGGASEEELTDFMRIGQLHDVGKMEVPIDILTKPGLLNRLEKDTMNLHPIYSSNDVAKLPETAFHNQRVVLDAILYHHEDYNGKGYPDGLAGEKIPREARILRIVDSFDAIRSRRYYKDANSIEETMKKMNDASGQQFDPELLTLFDSFVRKTYKNEFTV